MKKIKVKVIGSQQALRSLAGKNRRIHAVPMVSLRGYIADIERLNKQIKQIEKELETERRKLYGVKQSKKQDQQISKPITIKP